MGKGYVGQMQPKYQETADLSDKASPRAPTMKLCRMNDVGHLTIPKETRQKWLQDPVRRHFALSIETCFLLVVGGATGLLLMIHSASFHIQDPDWRTRLKNFGAVFQPVAGNEDRPQPKQGDEEVDLASESTGRAEGQNGSDPDPTPDPCPVPPSMTEEVFKQKYPTLDVTVTVNMGCNVTCYSSGGNVFLQSPGKIILPGVRSETAQPLFMYAGGSWVSKSAKVP